MTVAEVLAVLVVAGMWAVLACLWATDESRRWRRQRREVDRCGRVQYPRVPPPVRRADPSPSPRPRVVGDYEWRAIAEGEMQT